MLPVLDKTIGHLSAEQDGVARIREMVDEGQESFIHVHGHPVQLTLWACNKAINGDLHLQFELPHDSSVVDEESSTRWPSKICPTFRCRREFACCSERRLPDGNPIL